MRRNEERAAHLQHYTCGRRYRIEYHGFPSSREASMKVAMTYDAPGKKSFKVLSETGSKLLIDRVLSRLMESEREAALDAERTALTPANYNFELQGMESGARGSEYILGVQPRVDSKFLYRGKIWVDAVDFAVTRIEAEPARDPSFWIRKTEIHHQYLKVGEFWLPEQNRTETRTRLGGTADLTIDYFDYKVAGVR
ncbi:MAG TPA: hypothetical protein VGD59_02565 [Acidisarcina sp.]